MKTRTIQQTSKVIKLQIAISFLVLIVGVIMWAGTDNPNAPAIFFVGLFWYLGAKLAAWWCHG